MIKKKAFILVGNTEVVQESLLTSPAASPCSSWWLGTKACPRTETSSMKKFFNFAYSKFLVKDQHWGVFALNLGCISLVDLRLNSPKPEDLTSVGFDDEQSEKKTKGFGLPIKWIVIDCKVSILHQNFWWYCSCLHAALHAEPQRGYAAASVFRTEESFLQFEIFAQECKRTCARGQFLAESSVCSQVRSAEWEKHVTYVSARNLGFAHRFIHINYQEPLFLGLGFMFLGLGFGTIVFCFRVYVFRVRVWNHCF